MKLIRIVRPRERGVFPWPQDHHAPGPRKDSSRTLEEEGPCTVTSRSSKTILPALARTGHPECFKHILGIQYSGGQCEELLRASKVHYLKIVLMCEKGW